MSKIVSSCLYFTSFLPLWISIIFIDIKSMFENTENLWTEIISVFIIVLVGIVSTIVVLFVFTTNSEDGLDKRVIKEVTEDKAITSEFYFLCFL